MSELFLPLAVLALASGLGGLFLGRYLWPRRVEVPGEPPPPEDTADDLEPALSSLEDRLRASESAMDRLRKTIPRRPGAGDSPPV